MASPKSGDRSYRRGQGYREMHFKVKNLLVVGVSAAIKLA